LARSLLPKTNKKADDLQYCCRGLYSPVTPPPVIGPFQEPFVTTLKTNETLLNVTLIGYDSVDAAYVVNTYKRVDPTTWTSLLQGTNYRSPGPPLTSTNASVLYTNVPHVNYNGLSLDNYSGGYNVSWTYPTANTILANYYQYSQKNYLYLLMPDAGLCSFYLPKGIKDTVDLIWGNGYY
jgi:hypothetical protein